MMAMLCVGLYIITATKVHFWFLSYKLFLPGHSSHTFLFPTREGGIFSHMTTWRISVCQVEAHWHPRSVLITSAFAQNAWWLLTLLIFFFWWTAPSRVLFGGLPQSCPSCLEFTMAMLTYACMKLLWCFIESRELQGVERGRLEGPTTVRHFFLPSQSLDRVTSESVSNAHI